MASVICRKDKMSDVKCQMLEGENVGCQVSGVEMIIDQILGAICWKQKIYNIQD